jgi:hypothetical protein
METSKNRMIELINEIKGINSNTPRGLAMSLAGVFKRYEDITNESNNITLAWTFIKQLGSEVDSTKVADLVSDKYKTEIKVASKKDKEKKVKVEFEPSAELKTIADNPNFSKNEKVKRMYAMGVKISDIAKTIGITYQRAKNVIKVKSVKTAEL